MATESAMTPLEIRIGLGTCGVASGALAVAEAAERAVRDLGVPAAVKAVGCGGLCHQEPIMEVVSLAGERRVYGRVSPDAVRHIVARHAPPRGLWRRAGLWLRDAADLLLDDRRWTPLDTLRVDREQGPTAAYLGKQARIVLENCGEIAPLRLDDYLARAGYSAWRRVVEQMTPDETIDAIARSGLRGRGGGGFPTGRKWGLVRRAAGGKKYVVCNGDEGDPGAFMDRLVLEADPHRVIEGMAVAAWCVGADEGYLYIRAEYPLAVRHVREAVAQAEQCGFLGRDIFGRGVSLALHVMEGAGAFVCGEETALMASIEGFRGSPRLRPPYPSESGLWGRPTLVNNVETFACVPWILRHGPEAFAAIGTPTSRGAKVFALAGKVKRGGLIEVPMGLTIREIVDDIGGGLIGDRPLKAVQIGGPAGGCIPASLASTPVDYEAISELGAIMGSGGLVVLDDTDCMVDIARFFLEFTQLESCGRCTFCRVGTKRMIEILERLCEGHGRPTDVAELEDLALQVRRTTLCGLGHNAPNPVLTTIKYFRDEYDAHAAGRCPAGKCRALIRYEINDRCIGCTRCAQNCPTGAIAHAPYEQHRIDPAKCVRCGMCRSVCPSQAVEVKT